MANSLAVSQLIGRESELFKRISNSVDNLKKLCKNNINREVLEKRFDRLRKNWNFIIKICDRFRKLISNNWRKLFNYFHTLFNRFFTQITQPGWTNIFRIFRLSQLLRYVWSIHNERRWFQQLWKVANFKIACNTLEDHYTNVRRLVSVYVSNFLDIISKHCFHVH